MPKRKTIPKWKILWLAASGKWSQINAMLMWQICHGRTNPTLALALGEEPGTLFFRRRDQQMIAIASRIGTVDSRALVKRLWTSTAWLLGVVLAALQIWQILSGDASGR